MCRIHKEKRKKKRKKNTDPGDRDSSCIAERMNILLRKYHFYSFSECFK